MIYGLNEGKHQTQKCSKILYLYHFLQILSNSPCLSSDLAYLFATITMQTLHSHHAIHNSLELE